MKNSLTIIMATCLPIAFFVVFYACKTTTPLTGSVELSNTEIQTIAHSVGYLNNALIDRVGKENDLPGISDAAYKKAIYAVQIPNYYIPHIATSFVFDKAGIAEIDQYMDTRVSSLTATEKKYLKSICSVTAIKNFDKLMGEILNDADCNTKSKIMLAGSIEIAKTSIAYWNDAVHNTKNPYHSFASKRVKANELRQLLLNTKLTDIGMFVIAFNNYLNEQQLPPDTAANIASLDAAYQSGLAGMAGKAVVN